MATRNVKCTQKFNADLIRLEKKQTREEISQKYPKLLKNFCKTGQKDCRFLESIGYLTSLENPSIKQDFLYLEAGNVTAQG